MSKLKNFISNLRLRLGLDVLFSDIILQHVDKLLSNPEFLDKLLDLLEKYEV